MKLSDLKEGDVLRCDAGFTCIEKNSLAVVNKDDKGKLWIACRSGRHYLDGQEDKNGELIGLAR